MSMHYFGPGEYPYKSILRETTCESAPYVLKNLGYTTHAVHNNEANFYGRRSIFPNLGFDTFTSEEYMARENEKNPNGWVKDEVLTDEILKCLDSTRGGRIMYYYYFLYRDMVRIRYESDSGRILRSQFPVHRLRKRTINGNIT